MRKFPYSRDVAGAGNELKSSSNIDHETPYPACNSEARQTLWKNSGCGTERLLLDRRPAGGWKVLGRVALPQIGLSEARDETRKGEESI
ncbi:hypothetical protein MKZ38_009209 [Zalerion maritima]|uniref:Uncharacterized protein n=1 Tax=Zalerion maritima TaxID=339359 RepID=A0AAD5RG32_9PEZI|nr:hypothetical protein MKZ38_009209 [Zalerion maritima]